MTRIAFDNSYARDLPGLYVAVRPATAPAPALLHLNRALADAVASNGLPVHLIGGADVAAELDAKRAIDQGTRLAARL